MQRAEVGRVLWGSSRTELRTKGSMWWDKQQLNWSWQRFSCKNPQFFSSGAVWWPQSMIRLLGGIDQAAPLASLRQPEPRLCSDLAWACGQGCLDASRQRFRRADGAQLLCFCVSVATCSTQSEHGVPGSNFPRVEGQSAHFALGLCLAARPGSVPSSNGLGVTGFLWCAPAKGSEEGDAKSAHWLLELEDADPYIVL